MIVAVLYMLKIPKGYNTISKTLRLPVESVQEDDIVITQRIKNLHENKNWIQQKIASLLSVGVSAYPTCENRANTTSV